MKSIYTLQDLELTSFGLRSIKLEMDDTVFLQQGSLDGACGPYCLFMGLLILGEIESDQAVNLNTVKGSSRLGKMLKKLANLEVLIHNGTTTKELTDILDHGFKKRVKYRVNSKSRNRQLVQFIIDELADNNPVLVTVRNEKINVSHWLLAIGYETDNDIVTKIFFLDPSRPLHENQYWNAVIVIADNFKMKYHHQWLEPNNEIKVLFDDCFSIGSKNV